MMNEIRAAILDGGENSEHQFALVEVPPAGIHDVSWADGAAQRLGELFPGMPLLLAAITDSGSMIYHGRMDLIAIAERSRKAPLPWRLYKFT
jgi:hypothetical protein